MSKIHRSIVYHIVFSTKERQPFLQNEELRKQVTPEEIEHTIKVLKEEEDKKKKKVAKKEKKEVEISVAAS